MMTTFVALLGAPVAAVVSATSPCSPPAATVSVQLAATVSDIMTAHSAHAGAAAAGPRSRAGRSRQRRAPARRGPKPGLTLLG
jgi:hypothetical protein